ncbi:MAG: hypothetical protein WC294_06095 [Methanoregula sp.]
MAEKTITDLIPSLAPPPAGRFNISSVFDPGRVDAGSGSGVTPCVAGDSEVGVWWIIGEEPEELSFWEFIAKKLSFGGRTIPKRIRENTILPTIRINPVFILLLVNSTGLQGTQSRRLPLFFSGMSAENSIPQIAQNNEISSTA